MTSAKPERGAANRRLVITATAVLLALAGAACIGVAVSSQQPPPAPALTTARAARTPAAPSTTTPTTAVPSAAPTVLGPVMTASKPVRLDIPAIGVKTPLLSLGQTATGAMEVPAPGPHYDEAGWYRYSPTPGTVGPAVITGHVDSSAHGPSVFFRLGDLRPRDRVNVTRADGSVAVFAVDEVRRFTKTSFPSALVYGNTNHAALRLVTCGGPFDRASGHYRDNIVVLASLILARP